jgi:hypothetical protein
MFSNAAAIEKANQILVKQKLYIKELDDLDVSTISTESTRAPLNDDSESDHVDRREKEDKIRNLRNLSKKMNEPDTLSDNQDQNNQRRQTHDENNRAKLADNDHEIKSETTVSDESFKENASKRQQHQKLVNIQSPKDNGPSRFSALNNKSKSKVVLSSTQAQLFGRQYSNTNTKLSATSSHSNPNLNVINAKNKKTKPVGKQKGKERKQFYPPQPIQEVTQNDFIFYKTQPDSEEEEIEPIAIDDASSSSKNVRFDFDSKSNLTNMIGNKVILHNFTNDHSKDYSSSDDENDSSNKQPSESTTTSQPEVILNAKFMREMFNHNKSSKIGFDTINGETIVTPLLKSRQLYAINERQQADSSDQVQGNTPLLNETVDSLDQANDKLNRVQSESDKVVEEIDFSIFDLIDKTSKVFIFKPATIGLTMRAQIFRQAGIYPEYKFYIETLDGNLQLIMTARKKKKSKTPCYVINYLNYDPTSELDYIETTVAKLKSNLLGTQFTLYDFGLKPTKLAQSNVSSPNPSNNTNLTNLHALDSARSSDLSSPVEIVSDNSIDQQLMRKHYAFISYEMNVLGVKGPRQMQIVIPGMDDQFNREDFRMKHSADSLASAWKSIDQRSKETTANGKAAKIGEPKSAENAVSPLDDRTAQITPISEASETNETENQTAQPSGSKSAKNPVKSKLTALKKNLAKLSPKKKKPMKYNAASKSEEAQEAGCSNPNVIKLINKAPEWNKQMHSFVLSFNNRVTLASVKNFQVVHESNTDYIIMQFGKVNRDLFTCDYAYPLCALQAFGIALSSIDDKLACD